MTYARKAGALETRQGRRQHDFVRASLMRQLFPEVAELRIEIEFDDGSAWVPSPQSFSYFPAARGFFRFACPCHACNGEFDLTSSVSTLARARSVKPRSTRLEVTCEGQRARENESVGCAMRARVSISAIARSPDDDDEG
jgi:hypothetical protein